MKYIGYLLKIGLAIIVVSCGSEFKKYDEPIEQNDTISIDTTKPACQYKLHEQQKEMVEVENKLDSIEFIIKEKKKERRKLKKKLKNGY